MAAAFAVPMAANAQAFPDKPVRVIMPFPVGTGSDVVMRLLGEKLTKIWNQPVIVDNRPGGAGFIAMTAAKRSPADGYTFALVDDAIVSLLPHLFAKTIPYDSQKDFDPVTPIFRVNWFLAVPADTPFKSVADLVAEAKAKQGSYSYASSGMGSAMHLFAAMFENQAGVRMTHVPYKETPQAITDISRNEIGWAFTTAVTGGPMYRAKKVKFLAIGAPQRHPAFPDIPTVAEAGGPPNFEMRTWVGLFAPRGTPVAVMEKVNADFATVLADPAVRDQLNSMGFETWSAPAATLSRQLEADLKKYGDITKQLKISLD